MAKHKMYPDGVVGYGSRSPSCECVVVVGCEGVHVAGVVVVVCKHLVAVVGGQCQPAVLLLNLVVKAYKCVSTGVEPHLCLLVVNGKSGAVPYGFQFGFLHRGGISALIGNNGIHARL